MRYSSVAAAVFLSLGVAAATATAADTSSAAAASAPPSPAAAGSGDAAAKHAKRTACLKTAKNKKLLGADKTSFLKTCIAAP